jgi:AcrR family transcriptional regulator
MTELNEKQTRILLVAEKLFAEKGFDGTSIRDISREAKINIAMVSYYFGSKEKMLEALIISRTSDMRLQLENIQKLELSPAEKVDRLIELYIQRVNRNRCMYQIIHFELSSKKRDLRLSDFNDMKKRNLETLTTIINEGQEKGVFRKDVRIELIPTTIIGTYFQFQMSRSMFEEILNLRTDRDYDHFVKNELTQHIKQLIKALLKNENQ